MSAQYQPLPNSSFYTSWEVPHENASRREETSQEIADLQDTSTAPLPWYTTCPASPHLQTPSIGASTTPCPCAFGTAQRHTHVGPPNNACLGVATALGIALARRPPAPRTSLGLAGCRSRNRFNAVMVLSVEYPRTEALHQCAYSSSALEPDYVYNP
ncbi:hypothetical protein K438DRAFT_1776435 [Mycena galopus ATCC 62051]|nr:hypothetical protein K438DRAFT_1776435 [Mycena galopus ATCC 62051]